MSELEREVMKELLEATERVSMEEKMYILGAAKALAAKAVAAKEERQEKTAV